MQINGPKKLALAAHFFAIQLGISDFELNIRTKKLKKSYGYCEQHSYCDYTIIIAKDAKNKIKILAHEMVHVKQYINKELVDEIEPETQVGFTSWKGARFDGDYYDRPWEIEAFGLQRSLFHRYTLLGD